MKIRHILAVAAAGLVLATTTAAHAAGPPYTVTVGSSTSGTQAITFSSTGTVQYSWRNSAGTVIAMICTSFSGTGTITKGAGVNPYGSITSTTWSGCAFVGGAATITQNGTWSLAGTGGNATSGTETIAGNIGNFSFGLATTANPAICSFTVSGKLNTSFSESAQQLRIDETGYTGNAVISNAQGCLGRVQNGNPFDMVANLNVSTGGAGAINLS